ncbi:MAG: sigma-70 family RNA polymerase sigma factor, partial [Microcoleus sp.]
MPDAKDKKNSLSQQLQQLVGEACSHPPKSLMRRQKLSEIVRLIVKSGKLWQEGTPHYNDALQQTWIYFCRNVCEANTAKKPYDPHLGSVITWLDTYLKKRLQDFSNERKQEQFISDLQPISADSEAINLINYVENPPTHSDSPLVILEETKKWVLADPEGELRSVHIKKRPDVTCQILILKRLPPETSWEKIGLEFNLPPSTAPNFYKRECLPRLRNFAKKQGYLE